jgi:rod shape-determining protein MreC
MRNLLQLFIRNGGFVTLVVLETFCFYLVVNFNDRQNGIFAHTSMIFNQSMAMRRANFDRFIDAADSLQALNNQIFRLQTELENAKQIRIPEKDTFYLVSVDSIKGKISIPQYRYIGAEVVNNSITNSSNWITINRGSNHEIKPNMGVLSRDGLVGIVRYVSPDFAVVMSLLHRQTKISASLLRQGVFGSLVWNGKDPSIMTLSDIPKHVDVKTGDTLITSGFSSIFPKGVMIGTVVDYTIPSGSNFYNISMRLSHDMTNTDYVRVVENLYKAQLDTLDRKVQANEQ